MLDRCDAVALSLPPHWWDGERDPEDVGVDADVLPDPGAHARDDPAAPGAPELLDRTIVPCLIHAFSLPSVPAYAHRDSPWPDPERAPIL